MTIAFTVSLMVGILQLLLAWFGGVASSERSLGTESHVFVGYVTSFHWWVSYVILVPTIVACTVPTWKAYARLGWRYREGLRYGVLALTLVIATVIVLPEVTRSILRGPFPSCQWNYQHCQPSNPDFSPAIRWGLVIIGYTHEFIGYAGLLFTVISVLVLCAAQRTWSPLEQRRVFTLLVNQRLCVAAYVVYLILLRSSKVGIYLSVNGTDYARATTLDLLSNWSPYFQQIPHGMELTLLMGAAWTAIALVSHLVVAHANVRPSLSDDALGAWAVIVETARLVGRSFLVFMPVALFLIVLPPPGGLSLIVVATAGVLTLAWQQRRAHK
jgi:hypothetical protein